MPEFQKKEKVKKWLKIVVLGDSFEEIMGNFNVETYPHCG